MPFREQAMQIDKWLTSAEVLKRLADIGLARAPGTLARWAHQKVGPPHHKDASRYRLYSERQLEDWIQERLNPSTNNRPRKSNRAPRREERTLA
jgi:hypothetical protein